MSTIFWSSTLKTYFGGRNSYGIPLLQIHIQSISHPSQKGMKKNLVIYWLLKNTRVSVNQNVNFQTIFFVYTSRVSGTTFKVVGVSLKSKEAPPWFGPTGQENLGDFRSPDWLKVKRTLNFSTWYIWGLKKPKKYFTSDK